MSAPRASARRCASILRTSRSFSPRATLQDWGSRWSERGVSLNRCRAVSVSCAARGSASSAIARRSSRFRVARAKVSREAQPIGVEATDAGSAWSRRSAEPASTADPGRESHSGRPNAGAPSKYRGVERLPARARFRSTIAPRESPAQIAGEAPIVEDRMRSKREHASWSRQESPLPGILGRPPNPSRFARATLQSAGKARTRGPQTRDECIQPCTRTRVGDGFASLGGAVDMGRRLKPHDSAVEAVRSPFLVLAAPRHDEDVGDRFAAGRI